jgi:SulP family sulfate permease
MDLFRPFKADYTNFKTDWKKDFIAGVTVGIVALPLALAFGITTGAGAKAGLVTAIIAGFLAAIFGGSNYQVSGPTGAMTVVLVPIVSKYGVAVLVPTGITAGLLLILFGIFKLGNVINKIPIPVMEGFTLGIALVITLQQIPNAFAIANQPGHGTVGTAINTLKHGFHIGFSSKVISLLLLTLLVKFSYPVLSKKLKIKVHIPASFVVIFLITAITLIFSIQVPTVGNLPRNIFAVSKFTNSFHWSSLAIPAIEIALLAAIESLLSARVADAMAHRHEGFRHYEPNRELFGQGLASALSSAFGGMPATGAIARTGVNVRSGAKSRMSAAIHAIFLLLAVFLLNPLIAKIPSVALAGILIGTSYRIARPSSIKEALTSTKIDAAIYLITAFVVLFVDLIWGIAIGTLLYFAFNSLKSRLT